MINSYNSACYHVQAYNIYQLWTSVEVNVEFYLPSVNNIHRGHGETVESQSEAWIHLVI